MKLFDFLQVRLVDAADVILVGLLLYYIYRILKDTVAINIFIGIVIIFVGWKITQLAGMQMLSGVLGQFVGMGFLALVVVFQQEVRRFLLAIGSTRLRRILGGRWSWLRSSSNDENYKIAKILVNACRKMGQSRTGALIILERNQSLDFVKNTGDTMSIALNEPILESIFYKNSPLHDGAIIVEKGYVVATRVILPVSQVVLPKQYGLRHRAAFSITEKTDAVVLVVSEETGKVSYIKNTEFVKYDTDEELVGHIATDLD